VPACFIREDRLFCFCLLKEAFSKVGKKSGVVKATLLLLLLRGGVLDFTLSHCAGHLQNRSSAASHVAFLHIGDGSETALCFQFRSFHWAQDCCSEARAVLLSPKCLLTCQTDKAFLVHYLGFTIVSFQLSMVWQIQELYQICLKSYTSSKHV